MHPCIFQEVCLLLMIFSVIPLVTAHINRHVQVNAFSDDSMTIITVQPEDDINDFKLAERNRTKIIKYEIVQIKEGIQLKVLKQIPFVRRKRVLSTEGLAPYEDHNIQHENTSMITLKNDSLNNQPDLYLSDKQKIQNNFRASKLSLAKTVLKSIDFITSVENATTDMSPKKILDPKVIIVTAGKVFSYTIPKDLFIADNENRTHLNLMMFDKERIPLKPSSWVQFNTKTREVYGLPLEEHCSKWEYVIQATDSKGDNGTAILHIQVQKKLNRRGVNHEFYMKLKIDKKFSAAVDWQIRTLKGLLEVLPSTDLQQITVSRIDMETNPVQFMWINDTLSKYCPRAEIMDIMNILHENKNGEPSLSLITAMSPQLIVTFVSWLSTGTCNPPQWNQNDNYIKTTTGRLLVIKMLEDSLYGIDKTSLHNLEIILIREDGSTNNGVDWLHIDLANGEFSGIPMKKDTGLGKYYMYSEDKMIEELTIDIRPVSLLSPVEFQATLDVPCSSSLRTFVESLQELFGDEDASMVTIKSITCDPTVVTWYNTSFLGSNYCPKDEILNLENILFGGQTNLTPRVEETVGKKFTIASIKLEITGACLLENSFLGTSKHTFRKEAHQGYSPTIIKYYCLSIIPIIICLLIIIATVFVCNRHRRQGSSINISRTDRNYHFEHTSFQRQRIPVIFNDLDEKNMFSVEMIYKNLPPTCLQPRPCYKPRGEASSFKQSTSAQPLSIYDSVHC